LIQDLFAILSVDAGELATNKNFSGCVIQNNADLDISSIRLVPINMSCGQAMLSFMPNPFASPFLPRLFMGQAFFLKIYVYAVMRDAACIASYPLLFMPNYPVHYHPVRLHIP
jgi:hypothetical protein